MRRPFGDIDRGRVRTHDQHHLQLLQHGQVRERVDVEVLDRIPLELDRFETAVQPQSLLRQHLDQVPGKVPETVHQNKSV